MRLDRSAIRLPFTNEPLSIIRSARRNIAEPVRLFRAILPDL